MKKNLGYIFTVVFLALLSCSEDKKGNRAEVGEQKDLTTQVVPLDPKFDSYQVVMVDYDTNAFSQQYGKRIDPPVINLNQSLDNQSISDLYLLSNTLLAMKGLVFSDAILSAYFKNMNWYQPPFWDENFEINLNDEEKHFLNRIERQINELRNGNLTQQKIPNPENAVNRFQYESLPLATWDKIAQNGYVILDKSFGQPTSQYLENHTKSLPPIVTTDMVLHQLHLFYGSLENEIEAAYLSDILKSMLEIINVELYSSYEKTLDPAIEKAIEESLLYYSIPYAVITGNKTNLIGNYNQIYFDELEKVLEGEGTGSKVIKNNDFNYQVFKPHGHYTKNDEIQKYYKAITWLQKISLCLNDDEEFSRAILIAYIINRSPDLKKSYEDYSELKTYFSSQKDQFTFWDLADVINQVEGIMLFEDLFKEETVAHIKDMLGLKDSESCQIRVSLMPVEYQNLYTDLSQSIKDNDSPSPVQLFAALQNQAALRLADSQENAAIMDNLLNISKQEDAKSIDWLSTLIPSLDERNGMPPAMNLDAWKMKTLNAAMASWVQLNERVNIQAKRIVSDPAVKTKKTILKGYVEPNISFWDASLTLLQNTRSFFNERHMLSNHTSASFEELSGLIGFLKAVSQKQINHLTVTAEEFDRIAKIGAEFQNLAFSYLKLNYRSETHELSNAMAYATDVYQGGKNKNLVSGIGYSHVIIVPVEIGDFVYLTRGAVYSYYEIHDYAKTYISPYEWKNMMEIRGDNKLSPWMKDYYNSQQNSDDGIVASK